MKNPWLKLIYNVEFEPELDYSQWIQFFNFFKST